MSGIELKAIDIGVSDFGTFVPDIADNFCIWATLSIGPKEIEGSHLFQVGICTPKWLDHNIQNKGPVWGRHLLMVHEFNSKAIREVIIEMIAQCERLDWSETANILSRHFAWEFEDYKMIHNGDPHTNPE